VRFGACVSRRSGLWAVWYAKYRLPDGRQVKKKIGPAWAGRGRPAEGYFSRRTAEDWLDDVLTQARERVLAGPGPDDVSFEQAAREWLRYAEQDRGCKPSTMRGYRSSVEGRLIPAFGGMLVAEITPAVLERWRAGLPVSARMKNKLLIELHGIFKRAAKLSGIAHNPAADVELLRVAARCDIEVFSPQEVMALVRAAADAQDAAIYLTAAFTGLRRGELIALRWRDVDLPAFLVRVRASYAAGQLTTPKSGRVRAVPLAPQVATALARLGDRPRWTAEDDLAFCGTDGGYLDGSALRRRYLAARHAAGLRPLRFHDLRHTFATRVIAKADIVRVQEWMGHADIQTTRKYLHYAPRPDDAQLVADAFTDHPRSAPLAA
jgi:integrase